ncbi:NAD(P)H-hydrate epimerase [Telmatocola sphagniphila]|uniref:NAD(P)H-hydrate epimerase n=1 Tax=Telmatocola sphagniphila TaxID=1123043 RepID=A0A8E6EV39_9BACT|nr:NAD(P)H-hydrate epimerase [Telmatocola sphagniphila]QVL32215.1 NAD(P)H-hydrate epimerase [Telmatocola sphagniphila]
MISYSREQVRAIDKQAIEQWKVPGVVLMENAGRGAAELLMGLLPSPALVTIFCGSGNNGGDGFVIARHLLRARYPVEVIYFSEQFAPDAQVNFEICRNLQLTLRKYEGKLDLSQSAWLVDALFGTGLNRPLESPFDTVIEVMNSSGKPILAVDIPSGLDGDSGLPLGSTVRASHTVTFVGVKKGFLNPLCRPYLGQLHIVDIGVPTS